MAFTRLYNSYRSLYGLRGRLIHLHRWILLCLRKDTSNDIKDNFIFKSVQHFRLQNERDVLKRFQGRSTHIRPLLDEIDDPPAIIIKYLQHDLLQVSNTKDLTRNEIKFVARHVLEALKVLHQDGFVHTGMRFNDQDWLF